MQKPRTEDQTDWEYVKNTPDDAYIAFDPDDELYDPNDDAAVDAFFATAVITRGLHGQQTASGKKVISMRLSEDVLKHYTATGDDWQERVEEVLRKAMG